MSDNFDCLGFPLPKSCSESHKKYLRNHISDPDEFLRTKHAESAWIKLSQAFNEGKCSVNQLYAEIHQMRQSVIEYGIPISVRERAYLLLANLTDENVEEETTNYQTLINNFFALPESNSIRKDIKQDLERTFPSHEWFSSDSESIDKLQRVLGAFSIHNSSIGYCQSLNFLAGFLLIIFQGKEIHSFLLLCHIIEEILEGYHSRSLVRIMADMNVLEALIENRIQKVHQQLKKYNVSISLFAPNWFMSGFTNYLPSPVVAQLWDWMLLDKDLSVLFRMALGILSLKEEGIITSRGTNELVTAISDPQLDELTNEIDLCKLVSYIHNNIKRVPLATLQELREEAFIKQQEEFTEYQTKKEMVLLPRTTHFDKTQLSLLKSKFSKIANEEGYISVDQFGELLQRLPVIQNNQELCNLYKRIFAKNGNSMIEFTDIATGLSVLLKGTSKERLKLIFEVFDIDNSGYLERGEVTNLINTIYEFFYDQQEHPETAEFVNIIFKNLDTSNLGRLSFQEFEGALLLEPKLARCFVLSKETDEKTNDNNNSKDEDVKGLLPMLTDEERLELIKSQKKYNSRSELLHSIDSQKIKKGTATHIDTNVPGENGCCIIS